MESISISEAKSKFSELVKKAEAGQEVVIARHGRPVAKLVPARRVASGARASAFSELEAFSKTIKARRFNLREVIRRGRR